MPDSMPPAEELATLRAELAQKDAELVQALGDRMRLIGQVARVKEALGLAAFDREREGALLDALTAKAASVGLHPSVVREVFTVLLSASRSMQRRYLLSRLEKFTIGVLGGTEGMGAFLARVFREGGFPVEVTGLDAGGSVEELAASNELIVIAVPLALSVEVIGRVGPHLQPGACLMDIASITTERVTALLRSTREDVDVVGAHLLFEPRGDDFDGQKVVLCRGRGEEGFARVNRLLETFGAEAVEARAADPDAQGVDLSTTT